MGGRSTQKTWQVHTKDNHAGVSAPVGTLAYPVTPTLTLGTLASPLGLWVPSRPGWPPQVPTSGTDCSRLPYTKY
eukprot:37730-Chlamydomonas_euryale.AAC.1